MAGKPGGGTTAWALTVLVQRHRNVGTQGATIFNTTCAEVKARRGSKGQFKTPHGDPRGQTGSNIRARHELPALVHWGERTECGSLERGGSLDYGACGSTASHCNGCWRGCSRETDPVLLLERHWGWMSFVCWACGHSRGAVPYEAGEDCPTPRPIIYSRWSTTAAAAMLIRYRA